MYFIYFFSLNFDLIDVKIEKVQFMPSSTYRSYKSGECSDLYTYMSHQDCDICSYIDIISRRNLSMYEGCNAW